ncbi:hypothetical protein E2493_01175 [Sphingomonas parva]|uniref:Formyl transferase N-terminal domain-containing protein n=1 Tax=Sphingomonas parva TaxID=2555898 RepID=A0A4Y8ZWX7_9SPHN|nr:formyltransferase family protein [Sphingomonas parva]TFI59892.1 hypothetical protein E2493_01175 [Sphingomonas parva]
MIFVGGGSLLSQSVAFARAAGLSVNAVCCPPGDPAIPKLRRLEVPLLESGNPSEDLPSVLQDFEEDKVFSINNKFILSDALLSLGNEFFNIHNGLVQRYRGIAEVCIFAAICNGEPSYGVTLHRLLPNQKVDAGPVVAQSAFEIEGGDFASVMGLSLRTFREVFENNLLKIASGEHEARYVDLSGAAYSYRDVTKIRASAEPVRLARASHLGVYRAFFPELARLIESPLDG